MDNAQLVGLSRQIVLRRQMDLVANNLANMNTNGFKSQNLLMKETQLGGAEANAFLRFDRPVNFVVDDSNVYDLAPGRIETTGSPTDLALMGDGWFAVETPDGERYTRNGSFAVGNDGRLITRDGNTVLMEGGNLTFDAGETNFTVAEDGTVSTPNGVKGRLRIVSFPRKGDLTKVGETLFEGKNPEAATFPRLQQGRLERSNVKSVVEMSRMIEVSRAYEQVSNILQSTDKLQSDAIGQLGQIS